MDAKELRIGNYILFGVINEPIKITGGIDEKNTTIQMAKPIPLTEEWLLKFGFVKDGDSDTYNLCTEEYNEMCIEGYLQSEMNVMDINVTLKHVHQLQNLYFALTGKELTIKQLV